MGLATGFGVTTEERKVVSRSVRIIFDTAFLEPSSVSLPSLPRSECEKRKYCEHSVDSFTVGGLEMKMESNC